MSLADDLYFELSRDGLAPPLPFSAAPDRWREAVLRGIGDVDDQAEHIDQLEDECDRLRTQRDEARDGQEKLESEMKEIESDRDFYKRKFEALSSKIKEAVSA